MGSVRMEVVKCVRSWIFEYRQVRAWNSPEELSLSAKHDRGAGGRLRMAMRLGCWMLSTPGGK